MIKIYNEDNIKKKDLDYEEILSTVVDTIKYSDVDISNDKISSSDNLIELNAEIRQINCDWTYNLYCCYKFNKDNSVDYDIYLNPISCKEEFRLSDATELYNILKDIEEIMNV